MSRFLTLTLFSALLPLTQALAQAPQSFCVICEGPAKTYLCQLDQKGGTATTAAMKLHCIVNIAKDHKHSSCAARKNAAQTCQGEIVSYSYVGGTTRTDETDHASSNGNDRILPSGKPEPKNQAVYDKTAPNGQEPLEQKPPGNDEPKTLVELTDKAVKNSGKQLKKAGDAIGKTVSDTGKAVADTTKKVGKQIGNAAKSTFDCVISLFSKC